MDNVHRIATYFPIIVKLESMSHGKAKREHILIAISVLSILITIATPLGPLVTSTIGIVIPLHETMYALKKQEIKRHYIIFWMVFGILTALDAYSAWLTRMIPFFYTIKLFFLLWAGPIRFEAGEFLYTNFISKIPEKYYKFEKMEDVIKETANATRRILQDGKDSGVVEEGVKRLIGSAGDKKKD